MDRRKFIVSSLALPSVLMLKGCGGPDAPPSVPLPDLVSLKALPIPIKLEGTAFQLVIKKTTHRFFEGIDTNTYCVDDVTNATTDKATTYLAPTLFVKNGETVNINYTNNLGEKTTMHNHGMHLPADMDGGVHQIIKDGETWSANWTVKQKACTNWYHPHLMGKTAEQVYNGLAGLVIVQDDESESLDLPKTYGVDDIPLIIQDKRFAGNGQFYYSPGRQDIMHGYIGDTLMVNGKIAPELSVEAKQIRFRILNGSNARVYNLSLVGKGVTQIATDSALLEQGVPITNIKMTPAERVEIVVDFSADRDKSFVLKDLDSGKEIMKINVDKPSITAMTTMSSTLTSLVKFPYDASTPIRTFRLSKERGMDGEFTINGVSMNKNVINQHVPIDTVEIWEIINSMPMVHNFHIHATHFFIIERDGSASNVPDNEKGYKDTVRIDPRSSVKVLVKMVDYTTNEDNPYMFHCHILEHEDAGMMGQFTVV